jgi:hypothetical protein
MTHSAGATMSAEPASASPFALGTPGLPARLAGTTGAVFTVAGWPSESESEGAR